jgi:disulfide bond formation protein DsbB
MTPLVQNVTTIASFFTVLADIAAVILFIVFVTPLKEAGTGEKVTRWVGRHSIWLAFTVCAASLAGSIFYSGFAGFQPCELCWWQRIFLYPQTILLAIAYFTDDEHIHKYSIALSSFGFVIAAYNVWLQFGGSSIGPCSVAAGAVPCSLRYFLDFGYVTLPTMSLTAFGLLLVIMLFRRRHKRTLASE